MKQLSTILLLCCTLTAASCERSTEIRITTQNVSEDLPTVTREVPSQAFRALHASDGIEVILAATGDRILIEAPEKAIDRVKVVFKGSNLVISAPRSRSFRNARIKVTVPTDGRIADLWAFESATIISEVPITGNEVRLSASTSGDIIAAVNARKCSVESITSGSVHIGVHAAECQFSTQTSGQITAALEVSKCYLVATDSAEVTLTGSADVCEAVCATSAELNAEQFEVKRYDINVSTSAEADIFCTGELSASASTSGSLTYRGDCRVVKSEAHEDGSIEKD